MKDKDYGIETQANKKKCDPKNDGEIIIEHQQANMSCQHPKVGVNMTRRTSVETNGRCICPVI